MDSYRRLVGYARILVGGFLSISFLFFLNTAYSTLLVLIKEEFILTYTFTGALTSSYFIGYTIGQIPWGYLADRIGGRRVITLSIIGVSSSTILFGFSSSLWQLIVSWFLAGLLGAGVFVPNIKLISSWFSSGERGTALGLLNIGSSTGPIIASWVTPLLATNLGWRSPMSLFGISGIFISIAIWFTLQDKRGSEYQTGSEREKVSFIKSRSFWILALTQFLRLGSNIIFIGWLPLLLQEEYGLSLLLAGTALLLFNFSGMLSNPLGGFFSDRIGEKLIIVLSLLFLAFGVLLFASYKTFPLVFVFVFILGWFVNFIRSPSYAILPKLYGVKVAGSVSGIMNTFASLGALSLPFFIGYIRDVTDSYWIGWVSLSALLMFGTITNLFLRTTRKN
ncbi:MFS transporter [Candidatus Bathyarchaeota archaeon]|nr:MFS transporter [Candidatus Bathyarchaeota archaeon]